LAARRARGRRAGPHRARSRSNSTAQARSSWRTPLTERSWKPCSIRQGRASRLPLRGESHEPPPRRP
jgi:hypothetical protein